MSDIVGRDAFLDILDNRRLRIRILEKEPSTMDEALKIAIRLEALEKTENVKSDEIDYCNGRRMHTFASNEAVDRHPLQDEVASLRVTVEKLATENAIVLGLCRTISGSGFFFFCRRSERFRQSNYGAGYKFCWT